MPPPAGFANSLAAGVNESGDVVGYYSNSGEGFGVPPASQEAVLYNSQGTPKDVGNLGGSSQATGINDAGDVVGYSTTSTANNSPTNAFLYTGSLPPDNLGTLPGGTDSYATAIDDAGQIVGYSSTTDGSIHAFLTSGSSQLTANDDLGVPSGYTNSYATAISSDGKYIAGYATKNVPEGLGGSELVTEAFLYDTTDHEWTDVGNLGGTDSVALAVNASGDVVGYSTTPQSGGLGYAADAFLYAGSGPLQDLNTLIDSDSHWVLESATSINNKEVIAGVGTGPDHYFDGFLLYPPTPTPTPTPSPTPTPTPTSTSPHTPTPTPISTPTPIPTPTPPPVSSSPGASHTKSIVAASSEVRADGSAGQPDGYGQGRRTQPGDPDRLR